MLLNGNYLLTCVLKIDVLSPESKPRRHFRPFSSTEGASRAWRSQPTAADATDAPDELSAADMDALISYSQPAHADDLLLATPADAALAPLGRRMTRVWLRADEPHALAALADVLRARGYVWRRLHPRLVSRAPVCPRPPPPASR